MSVYFVTLVGPRHRYELIVRNKFIGCGAEVRTLEEMAAALRAQAELFEALKDPRIEHHTDGWADDYYHFHTNDATVAEKFGFDKISDESDEDNDLDEDDEG